MTVAEFRALVRTEIEVRFRRSLSDADLDELQEGFMVEDAWYQPILEYLSHPARMSDGTSIYEVLMCGVKLGHAPAKTDEMRAGAVMRRLGWKSKERRVSGKKMMWWRPVGTGDTVGSDLIEVKGKSTTIPNGHTNYSETVSTVPPVSTSSFDINDNNYWTKTCRKQSARMCGAKCVPARFKMIYNRKGEAIGMRHMT